MSKAPSARSHDSVLSDRKAFSLRFASDGFMGSPWVVRPSYSKVKMKVKPAAKSKFFHDPVYGSFPVSSGLLLKLIDSRAVQRLKHIRQLGTSFFTFLGAEHSRFSHSLGC